MVDLVGEAIGARPLIRHLPDQPGDVRRTYADVSRAEVLFGYRPSVPFEVGVRRFADWFLAERAASRSLSAA
jgi:UDP-glucuronate 4-epimerase